MRNQNSITLNTRLIPQVVRPVWGIVITVYKRYERLLQCLDCLYKSIRHASLPAHIVIMDSSPTCNLQAVLRSYLRKWSGPIGVRHVYFPRANQSQLRNEGLVRLGTGRIRYVLFLDSDIYLNRRMLETCSDYLDKHKAVATLAPPLISYKGISHAQVRRRFGDVVRGGEAGLIMPSKLDFQLFHPHGRVFIESHMLRGAFVIRRKTLKELFDDRPWHGSFEVWQNVDLFLTLRELKKTFGYVLDTHAPCPHDERSHPDTIRSWMPKFHEQTIKSLILLFHRNRLWKANQRILNQRFWDTIRPVVDEHCSESTDECLKEMLEVAHCLSISRIERQALLALRRLRSRSKVREVKTAIELLLEDAWNDIRSIRSYDLHQIM